jgi:hypothetical protein
MSDADKAARGVVVLLAAALVLCAQGIADAWQSHLDALTAADMAAAEIAYQQSGAQQAAEALVIWEMAREGRCAPSVPKAAAIPCPAKPRPVRRPAEHVWTVGPALKAVR